MALVVEYSVISCYGLFRFADCVCVCVYVQPGFIHFGNQPEINQPKQEMSIIFSSVSGCCQFVKMARCFSSRW